MKEFSLFRVAKLMIEVKKDFTEPLTLQLLLECHKMLMSCENRIPSNAIRLGAEPVQVISRHYGEIETHYQAPSSKLLPEFLKQFLLRIRALRINNVSIEGMQ